MRCRSPACVAAHIEAAERLAATDTEAGSARLWREAAGETAARFCHELIDAAGDFPPLPGRHYPALFEALAAGVVVRPAYGRHPRLAIWGLVEARLQQADLVVLGGLNEGTWPGPAAHDPWMSRQMRREFGIAVPERAIGIAAHDFAQAIARAGSGADPRRAQRGRADRAVALAAAPRHGIARGRPRRCARAGRSDPGRRPMLLDAAGIPAAAAAPSRARRSPLGRAQLSVTQIETWLRDPYAIYARHILDLRALDELDADPGRADLGICIHEALAEFVRRYPRELPADAAEAELLAIGRERHLGAVLSRPGAWAFWWPRFERIARWLVAEERTHRSAIVESLERMRGQLDLARRLAGRSNLTATADRIDRLADRAAFCWSTTRPARADRNGDAGWVRAAAAARRRDPARRQLWRAQRYAPAALEYWRLGGGDPAGEALPDRRWRSRRR